MRDAALEFQEKRAPQLSLPEDVLLKEVGCGFHTDQTTEVQSFNKLIDKFPLRHAVFLRAFGIDGGLDSGDHRQASWNRAPSLRACLTLAAIWEAL